MQLVLARSSSGGSASTSKAAMLTVAELGVPLLGALVLSMMAFTVFKRLRRSVVLSSGDEEVLAEEDVREEDDGKEEVLCYFGSQTGTAEGFAKDLATDLGKAGFRARAFDLEEFEPDMFMEKVKYAIFFMATYGEGDPCDNSIDFIAYLRKGAEEGGPPAEFAENVNFAVFGLGNTQYEQYNAMGKTVQERLLELGGKELHPLGLGDDDADMEEDFENWREGLVQKFVEHAYGAAAAGEAAANGDASKSHVSFVDEILDSFTWKARTVPKPQHEHDVALEGRLDISSSGRKARFNAHEMDLASRHFFQCAKAKVCENRELRQRTLANGGSGSTIHIEFDLGGTGITYNTADNMTVCAENDAAQVSDVAKLLDLSLDQWFILEPARPEIVTKPLFPTPCTVRAALSHFTDLNGPPSRTLLHKLASFASLSEHRERLAFLSSKDGKEDYHKQVIDRKLSIAEVFETFPSMKITQERLGPFFEVMPRLKGREFTIASSSKAQPDRVALCVGVILEEKSEKRILKGVASTHLQTLQKQEESENPANAEGPSALVFVKESSFKMPRDSTIPIIMVGPGTGIAPMRAFIQERTLQRENGLETGETVLFFGCRREGEDFLYKEELMAAVKSGVLSRLFTAFSRQQVEKIYVQHLIMQEKDSVWDLLNQGAHLYVCGATSMGKDVHNTILQIASERLGSQEQGKTFVADLQASHRYVQELWSS